MTNLTKKISKLMRSWNVDIHEQYEKDGVDIICTNMMILLKRLTR